MDITAIMAASAAGVSETSLFDPLAVQRQLEVQISPAARAELGIAISNAEATRPANPAGGLSQTIDRIRTEFDAMRNRLVAPSAQSVLVHSNSHASPAAQLESVMNQSIKMQTGIFQIAVSFQAGLTASQQTQSGIKTLVEKS